MARSSEKIPILQVIARLNIGGPAVYIILLTKLLSKRRFSPTLATGHVSSSEGDMQYLAEQEGVSPYVIPELGREIHWRNDLISLWKLYRLIRRVRPKIVHTHTAKAGILGRVAAKLAGVPIIVHTFHGHIFHSYFSRTKSRIFLSLERLLGKMSDAIITVSPKQREEILAYQIGTPEKVREIGVGLQLQQFLQCEAHRGKLRQELGLEPDVPLVGIIARLVPVKGHSYFLEAAQHVLEKYPKAQFVVAGDGELRESLEQYASTLGILPQVHFLGWRQDLPELYADLDLVVLSSLNEGLPIALIEAMAAGKPIVAAQVGGVYDLVQHGRTGHLVAPKDSAALAAGMIHVLELPLHERLNMGEAGRASVYPKYHIDTLVENIETVYHELLQKKGIEA